MKIVARRSADGRIVMLPSPVYTTIPSEGDIRPLKRRYQEFRRHSMLGYWRDVTNEVAGVVRQTFAPPAPPAAEEQP